MCPAVTQGAQFPLGKAASGWVRRGVSGLRLPAPPYSTTGRAASTGCQNANSAGCCRLAARLVVRGRCMRLVVPRPFSDRPVWVTRYSQPLTIRVRRTCVNSKLLRPACTLPRSARPRATELRARSADTAACGAYRPRPDALASLSAHRFNPKP